MLTKLLVFASMCKYVTLREKEFKQLPSKCYQDMVKTFHRISICRNIYTVPSLAAVLSIKPTLRSYAHSGTIVRADRHPRPRESRHDRHPRRRVNVLAGIAASCRITAARNSASMCPITLAINSQQLGRSNEQTRWEFAIHLLKRRPRPPPCCRGWRPLPSCDDHQCI